MPSQAEIREEITTRIVEALKKGTAPWRCPWRRIGPAFPTNVTGRRYSGTNILLLQIAAIDHGYESNLWGTYRQIAARGGHVRKGEKSTRIVFTKTIRKEVADADGDESRIETIPLLRTFNVFNIEQCGGDALDRFRPHADEEEKVLDVDDWRQAYRFVEATGADIRHGGDRAFYMPSEDYIRLPRMSQFTSFAAYFDVIWHELSHWSGIYSGEGKVRRLDCFSGSYAHAELIAEMSACFLSASLGLPNHDDLENHEKYLGSWLKEMENDAKWILKSASMASKVCDFILNFAVQEAEKPEPAKVA